MVKGMTTWWLGNHGNVALTLHVYNWDLLYMYVLYTGDEREEKCFLDIFYLVLLLIVTERQREGKIWTPKNNIDGQDE